MRIDPLAQTFSFERNRVVSAVGVQFTAKDPSMPVTVQIRGVTTSLPNSTVLAEKVVSPSEITLGTETKIALDNPFYAEDNQNYVVVLLTNSTTYCCDSYLIQLLTSLWYSSNSGGCMR